MLDISRRDSGVAFRIHVTPRARRPLVGGCRADALRVQVGTPPSDGLANAAFVAALTKAPGVRRSAVVLDPGSRSRRKRVRVDGDPDRLAELARDGPSA